MKRENLEIANRIRKYVYESGLTGNELAEAIDVSPAIVGRWLSGDIYPNMTNLCRLAYFFGTDPNELIGWDEYFERMEADNG